jgi:hypothetical protein
MKQVLRSTNLFLCLAQSSGNSSSRKNKFVITHKISLFERSERIIRFEVMRVPAAKTCQLFLQCGTNLRNLYDTALSSNIVQVS